MPCVAGAEHSAAEHHLESLRDDEQLLVPLQGGGGGGLVVIRSGSMYGGRCYLI